jgi:hypothetical protein
MRVRLAAGTIFVALLGVAAALASSASAESTPSAFGSRLVTLINNARAQHGLRALTVTSGTSTVAANWASHMASAQALSHNPNLGSQLESHGSPNWTTYSENVADGDTASADAMFTNYMNSPEHKANILDSHVRYVGVGVVFAGGFAWNTLDFVDQYNSTSSSSTSTQPAPAPKPATSSPKPATQAPRTATRPTTTTVTKRTAQAPHVAAPRAAARTATIRPASAHVVVQPRTVVTHTPAATSHRFAAAPAPAAHVMAAPSPVALTTTTPVQGAREDRTLALIAALGIVFVALVRVKVARALRAR